MVVSETDILKNIEMMDRGAESIGTSITWHSLTHGGSWRPRNEDAHCISIESEGEASSRYILALADGLGSLHGGEIASQTAIKSINEEFHNWNGGSPDRFVVRAVRSANQEVYNAAHVNTELANMQTTVTAVAVEQDTLAVGHVGDCRLYRIRGDQIELLTRDHSFASDLLSLHLISPEQVRQHPERNRLTRTVGSSPLLHVDVIRRKIIPDDIFVLCCDGLWSEVPEDAIKNIVQNADPVRACEELIELVLKGDALDNITVIVFRIVKVGQRRSSLWQSFLRR